VEGVTVADINHTFVILSEAKDLLSLGSARKQVLRSK